MDQLPEAPSTLTLALLEERVKQCAQCPLSQTRTHVVFGEGNPNANIMLVGEGPGEVEDQQGRPFVGPAGQKLDEVLASVNIKREDVYITNIVKCRPPENRVPAKKEMETCFPYLEAQIAFINPPSSFHSGTHRLNGFSPMQRGSHASVGRSFLGGAIFRSFPCFIRAIYCAIHRERREAPSILPGSIFRR